MVWFLNGGLKTWQKMSVLWPKMFRFWMVRPPNHLIRQFESRTKKCPKSQMFGFQGVQYSDGYCIDQIYFTWASSSSSWCCGCCTQLSTVSKIESGTNSGWITGRLRNEDDDGNSSFPVGEDFFAFPVGGDFFLTNDDGMYSSWDELSSSESSDSGKKYFFFHLVCSSHFVCNNFASKVIE